jgi:Cdc6-like AAA superfamily ATPase
VLAALYIIRRIFLEFEEYYKSLGLDTYPFSLYTAESETEQGDSIYKKPQNYSVIDEGIKGSSIIISGERGTGKTALNLDISRRKNTKETVLVKSEEFSKLEENYTPDRLYEFLTESIAGEFFRAMSFDPGGLWKYDKDERTDLSMYLHRYVKSSTKAQLTEQIKKIQNRLLKRVAIGLYNTSRVVLNYGLKAATKVASDTLTKHFSAPPEFDSGDSEYFKKLEKYRVKS